MDFGEFTTTFDDPENRLYEIDNYNREIRHGDFILDAMAVVSNPPKGFQVPVGHSCIITRSGVCLIPCELISGTWLRVIVNFPKSKCTVAMPIEPPIHTRVVDDPKSLTKQRLVFFGQLYKTENLRGESFVYCKYLGLVTNLSGKEVKEFPDEGCFCEFVFDEHGNVIVTKRIPDNEKAQIKNNFLPTHLSIYQVNDGTINGSAYKIYAIQTLMEANFNMDLFKEIKSVFFLGLRKVPETVEAPTPVESIQRVQSSQQEEPESEEFDEDDDMVRTLMGKKK